MGEWLADVAAGLRWYYAPAIEAGERRAELERRAGTIETNALLAEAEARAFLHQEAASLRHAAAAITTPPAPFALKTLQSLDTVASEMLSAPDGRATHLLSLASQFDAFRAPLRDPAEWVKRLGSAPTQRPRAHVCRLGSVLCR
ncbi:hypothetical protein O3S80_38740 [Streptomyces sp. Lzd4kr]|nr:hypothetical protein [Streptomyces sp. Lzd4kr]